MTSLRDIRVLDLTDDRAELAGRILADLGAEVVKVEPPGGVSSRRLGPFDGSGRSLYWAAYGAGKTCVELDPENADDKSRLLTLVSAADVLIESYRPGRTNELGLDYKRMSELNPGLVYASVSPYGQHGPKSHWPATDLTLEAAGGRLSIQGDQDRPPLPVGFPQASLHAGAQVAADIIVALNERADSGLGQHLDLSMMEAMWWTLMGAQGAPVCLGDNPPGTGDDRGNAFVPQGIRTVPASDGLVTIAPGGSPLGTRTMYTFAIEEAKTRGELPASLEQYDWNRWTLLYRDRLIDPDHMQAASALLDDYISRRTKLELIDWALNNNLRLGPLNTTRDLLEFPQFLDRGVFNDEPGYRQPTNWVKMSRTPLSFRPASEYVTSLPDWQPRQPVSATGLNRGSAFAGLKVADFSWVAAGPTIGKALADHGATVVKIESATRPDLSRTLAPHIEGEPGLNRSYWSFLYATSKLSLQCNLGTDEGKSLAREMCEWADVVLESFSPGTMARMGLSYETLSADRPELIMLSTSMLGQSGPLTRYAGYGQQATGFSGLHYITGWPDRIPCGVASPYTDVVAPKFGIAALAAAILERRRSGIGQYIDLAQAECAMLFSAPLILAESANGTTAERRGFSSDYACPQGVFPCAGTERYIAIAISDDSQWQNLKRLLPPGDHQAEGIDRWEERKKIETRLGLMLEAWTSDQDAFELEHRLTAAGVPASVVQRPMDVYFDPQIEARELKQTLPHGECGDVVHFGFCTRYSAKPQMVLTAPPCIGAHNETVLRELLGKTNDEIEAMASAGVLE